MSTTKNTNQKSTVAEITKCDCVVIDNLIETSTKACDAMLPLMNQVDAARNTLLLAIRGTPDFFDESVEPLITVNKHTLDAVIQMLDTVPAIVNVGTDELSKAICAFNRTHVKEVCDKILSDDHISTTSK